MTADLSFSASSAVARSLSPRSGSSSASGRRTRSTLRCQRPSSRALTRRPAQQTSPSRRPSTMMRHCLPEQVTSRRHTSPTSPRSPRGGSSARSFATGCERPRASSPTSSASSRATSSSRLHLRWRRQASPHGRHSRSRARAPSPRATGRASKSLSSSVSAAPASGACRSTSTGSKRRVAGRQTGSRRRTVESLAVERCPLSRSPSSGISRAEHHQLIARRQGVHLPLRPVSSRRRSILPHDVEHECGVLQSLVDERLARLRRAPPVRPTPVLQMRSLQSAYL